jgi:hypothetical protein
MTLRNGAGATIYPSLVKSRYPTAIRYAPRPIRFTHISPYHLPSRKPSCYHDCNTNQAFPSHDAPQLTELIPQIAVDAHVTNRSQLQRCLIRQSLGRLLRPMHHQAMAKIRLATSPLSCSRRHICVQSLAWWSPRR